MTIAVDLGRKATKQTNKTNKQAPIVRVCSCSMFCCTLLYVHSSFEIILIGKRKLGALLSLSSCCFLMVVWLFLVVQWVCLLFVIVVFPDYTHLLFLVVNTLYTFFT